MDKEGANNNGAKAWKYVLADSARWLQLIIPLSVVFGWAVAFKDLPRRIEHERTERYEADGRIIERMAKMEQWRELAIVGFARVEEHEQRLNACCPRWRR